MTRKECYTILGVRESATLDDVKKAYRKRAFELHPDLNPSPEASKQFQTLNEAYVLILTWLEEDYDAHSRAERSKTAKAKSEKPEQPKAEEKSSTDNAKPKKHHTKSAKTASKEESKGSNRHNGAAASSKTSSRASYSSYDNGGERDVHISQQEVMDNVLRDPFARRVFEDIYSEIRRGGGAASRALRKSRGQAGGVKDLLALRASRWGISSFKGWLRKQIDDEQTVEVPVDSLRPGMRIRLQIQHGMSGRTQNIEVTLPLDYTPGRPVRLRGLGRKIGPWLGDLYLRIIPKAA